MLRLAILELGVVRPRWVDVELIEKCREEESERGWIIDTIAKETSGMSWANDWQARLGSHWRASQGRCMETGVWWSRRCRGGRFRLLMTWMIWGMV